MPEKHATTISSIGQVIASGAVALNMRVATVLFTFGANALLARLLAPAEMGLFFLVLSGAAFLGLLVQLGLGSIAIREISRAIALGNPQKSAAVARKVILVTVSAGLCALSGTLLLTVLASHMLATWFEPRFGSLVMATVLLASLLSLQSLLGDIFRGYGRVVAANLFGGMLAAVIVLGGLTLLTWQVIEPDLTDALAVIVFGTITSTLIGCVLATRAPSAHVKISAIALIRQAQPFWWNGLTTFFFFQADLWIAGLILPLDQVALYGAASRFAQVLALPIEAIEFALPSLISSAFAQGHLKDIQKTLRQTAAIQTSIVGMGVAIFVLFGTPMLQLAFGTSYGEANTILAILALGWLARAVMGACGYTLSMTHQADILLKLTAGLGVVFLPIYFAAGMLFGSSGVAVSAATALAAINAAAAVVAWRKLGINVTVLPFRS